MKTRKIWIRIKSPDVVGDAQSYIMRLLDEQLGGEIPVTLYIENQKRVEALSHIYDLSEKAIIPLYEKFGEENVKCAKEKQPQDSQLERIAASLEEISHYLYEINDSLEKLSELSDCISEVGPNKKFCISGDVSTGSYY